MAREQPPKGIDLEDQIKEAVRLTKTVPPEYREKAFEILLKIKCSPSTYMESSSGNSSVDRKYTLPIHVVAFIEQFQISESNVRDHFVINGPGDIARKYIIENKMNSRSQIETACMLALENALHNTQFEFSFEEVRTACKENNCFDENHFMKNFQTRRNLFKSLDTKQNIELSHDGKKYLADLLIKLSNKLNS